MGAVESVPWGSFAPGLEAKSLACCSIAAAGRASLQVPPPLAPKLRNTNKLIGVMILLGSQRHEKAASKGERVCRFRSDQLKVDERCFYACCVCGSVVGVVYLGAMRCAESLQLVKCMTTAAAVQTRPKLPVATVCSAATAAQGTMHGG